MGYDLTYRKPLSKKQAAPDTHASGTVSFAFFDEFSIAILI